MPCLHRPVATVRLLDAAFPGVPFTIAAALSAGISRDQVRAAVGRGLVLRIARGVFVTRPTVQAAARESATAGITRLRVRAALLALPDAVTSHGSGRVLHTLPDPVPRRTLDPWADVVEVTRPGARPRRAARLQVHGSPLTPAEVVRIEGIPVTGLARTTVDVCRTHDLRGSLVVADAALRRLVTERVPIWDDLRDACLEAALVAAARAQLRVAVDAQAGWPGSREARRAVELADAGAESPLESRSRAEFLLAGLPRPYAGIPVVVDDGRVSWVDLDWPDFGVVGEADGVGKYDRPRALYEEKVRQDALERRGRKVVRWTGAELLRTPDVVVARVERALRERGWNGARRPLIEPA